MNDITSAAREGLLALLEVANLEKGDLFVIGCSSSEIVGGTIGKSSDPDAAQAVLDAVYPILKQRGIWLAAQCCEHLNRALVLETEAARAYGLPRVNVVPQKKAGGSFATCVWAALDAPCAVEHIRAAAGMDIGDTLIGMHLRDVAVPVRTGIDRIGQAHVVYARTRPKFIGGERAVYDPSLL